MNLLPRFSSKSPQIPGCPILGAPDRPMVGEPQNSGVPNSNLYQEKLHKMPRFTPLFAVVLALATTSVTNKAYAEPKDAAHPTDDPMPRAMQLELDREKAVILPGMQRPYFAEYHFDDIET